jgi:hypothetical protein
MSIHHLMKNENQEAACRLENTIFAVHCSKMVANGSSGLKRGHGITRNPLIIMVGGTGIEPVTSTV